jgi:hypothetical protein
MNMEKAPNFAKLVSKICIGLKPNFVAMYAYVFYSGTSPLY